MFLLSVVLGARFPGSGAFPYNMPMVRGDGDRGGRGRIGPPTRSHRGQSPPVIPPEGEPPMPPQEREKLDHKAGRGLREHHGGGTLGGGGGGGSGGRYARHAPDDRKIAPRMKAKHGGRMGVALEGDRGPDKSQLPPVSSCI